MSSDTENPQESLDQAVNPPVSALAPEPTDADSDTESTASPVSPPVELSKPLRRLKQYCDDHGLKTGIEPEPMAGISIELKNGRTTRAVYVSADDAAEFLLQQQLEEITFLGEYSAICSYKSRWIEAAVRAHGIGPRSFIARRAIFGATGIRTDDPAEMEIAGPAGLTLRITERRELLYWLDYGAPIYLHIEGVGITQHDHAVNLLEDLSNALFMQIDFRFGAPLTLGRERSPLRMSSIRRGALDEDNQLTYPRFSYERGPSALYWYARSAESMPLLQFLAFYQCIEFFFPQYSRQEVIAKVKNVLKNPSFDGTKDSSINALLNATLEGRRGSFVEERKQLAATLKHCVDPTALRDFFIETEERKQYYSADYKKISDKRINIADDTTLVEQTAERIYDIRCKVVHTKNTETSGLDEMILPFSREADLLIDDVELIKFLAQRVLIASSSPLKV